MNATTPTLLETVEFETAPNPAWTVLWLHGLGADGHDFAPIVPELVRREWPALRFVFRAITPPGRPRRFDARFFLVEARDIAGDSLDASGEELAHLQWLTLAGARALPLPFITEVVLSEVAAIMADPDPAQPVPFFHQTAEGPRFRLL